MWTSSLPVAHMPDACQQSMTSTSVRGTRKHRLAAVWCFRPLGCISSAALTINQVECRIPVAQLHRPESLKPPSAGWAVPLPEGEAIKQKLRSPNNSCCACGGKRHASQLCNAYSESTQALDAQPMASSTTTSANSASETCSPPYDRGTSRRKNP